MKIILSSPFCVEAVETVTGTVHTALWNIFVTDKQGTLCISNCLSLCKSALAAIIPSTFLATVGNPHVVV